MSKVDPKTEVVRLKPYQYIHVQDNNENVTRTIVGPATYTRKEHEQVLIAPSPCVTIPPNSYCIVENPVARDASNAIVFEASGQVKVRQGDREIRTPQQPFPLYPGEVLVGDVRALDVIQPNTAMRVKALRNFTEPSLDPKEQPKNRVAGDEWLIYGPCTLVPRIDVEVITIVNALIIGPSQGVKLRARNAFKDRTGVARKAGEEWLYEKRGAFIPTIDEDVLEVVTAAVLTEKKAIHVEALRNFKCCLGKERLAGAQWLVTSADRETYLPSPNERIIAEVPLICLTSRQYCVVQDYVDKAKGVQRFGQSDVRKGTLNFFLHPGESLEGSSVRDVYVLAEDEALLLTSKEAFTDEGGVARSPGDRWMIRGPREFVPRCEIIVVERRRSIPLDENEGVYIRDITTGHVRAHIGKTVMLEATEELWEKELQPLIEELIQMPRGTKQQSDTEVVPMRKRNKTSVIAYNVPHSSLVQIYDFKQKKNRTVLGPALVCLDPDEQFTLLSLSGGKPKQENFIRSLNLYLGPDFMTDILNVETSDHARLQLQLSYNWHFVYEATNPDKVFAVPDFVGDACKAMASRIRSAVAAESFDSFHKNSAQIIKASVFGTDKEGNIKTEVLFKTNGLVINNVDIHSVDPVDPKTREALTKSVQLAIEITTKSQEATARHSASTLEQTAKGKLERQVIQDRASSEQERRNVLQLEAENAAIESTGSSKAESKAIADSKLITSTNEVKLAQIKADTAKITAQLEVDLQRKQQDAEIEYKTALSQLEISKAKELAEIESQKFRRTIQSVGRNTIKSMATAGPALQARLLKGLGLQGYLVTDGSNPINLFNTAKGLTSTPGSK
jgi:major vault protein